MGGSKTTPQFDNLLGITELRKTVLFTVITYYGELIMVQIKIGRRRDTSGRVTLRTRFPVVFSQ